tara:strand:- start:130 stop:498 length:369 start_codon:yes stop_codon:yes gene_type:complete
MSPLEGNAFIKAKIDAENAGKTSFSFNGRNYPLKMEIDPEERKKYQDSIQKLHKPAYDEYVKRSQQGFEISDDDGQTMTQVAPRKPEDIKSLKDFAYTMEIAKGGSVTKDGVPASKLARMYK